MAYAMEGTADERNHVSVRLTDKGVSWRDRKLTPNNAPAGYAGTRGVPIDGSKLCFKAQVSTNRKTLPALFAGGYRHAVNQEIKDTIERIEPGVHQFFPFEVTFKDGSKPDDDYFLLNICHRLNAIDEGASVMRFENGKFSRVGMKDVEIKDTKMVVRKDLVAGLAAWTDERYMYDLICDELYDTLARLRVKTIDFWKVHEV